MEISGCLSATARDERFGGWKVAATAATCLTAPEKEAAPDRTGNPGQVEIPGAAAAAQFDAVRMK